MAGSVFLPGNTLMTNSVIGDKWIKETCEANPVAMLPREGRLIQSGPVRLAFIDTLFEPRAPTGNPGATPKYSVCALYAPFSDLSVYYSEYYRICGEMFPDYYNPSMKGYVGLENPFHDCALKSHKFEGFTPGLTYINHTSKFPPPIVDATPAQNQVDKSKVYPGIWAIIVVNAYGYGKSPPQPKKGVSFGLQAVMIIGDDQNLSGGGVDPREVFKNVAVKPPQINPAALAGLVPPQGPLQPPKGPQGGFMPPPPPNPLRAGMAHTVPAVDDPYDISSLA